MRTWNVTAQEILVHCWNIEAETEEEAIELAHEGCPLPDGDCTSQHFDIVSVKKEKAPTFRLEVHVNGEWIIAGQGLRQDQIAEESKAFTRFRVINEREESAS